MDIITKNQEPCLKYALLMTEKSKSDIFEFTYFKDSASLSWAVHITNMTSDYHKIIGYAIHYDPP